MLEPRSRTPVVVSGLHNSMFPVRSIRFFDHELFHPRRRHFVWPGVIFDSHSSTDCFLPPNPSIWFWNVSETSCVIKNRFDSFSQRANLPSNLQNPGSTIDTSTWSTPSGAWPSTTCNMTTYFTPQKVCLRGSTCLFIIPMDLHSSSLISPFVENGLVSRRSTTRLAAVGPPEFV